MKRPILKFFSVDYIIYLCIILYVAPGSERNKEERNSFWEEPSESFGSSDTRNRILVLGNLSARVIDVAVEGIIGGAWCPNCK